MPSNNQQNMQLPRIRDHTPARTSKYEKSLRSEQSGYNGQQQAEEKIVGGVSAKLDYDMDQMTDFVVQMTLGVINPPAYKLETFRSWVLQVLNATRLPSATILLSLSYMSMRVRGLISVGSYNPSEYMCYELLTVALILGSKFLDDNTFQNKSWAEVSNIKVEVLNKQELIWLINFDHRLHHDPQCADGFLFWEEQWISYTAKLANPTSATNAFQPGTVLGRQPSLRTGVSPRHRSYFPISAMTGMSLETDLRTAQYAPPSYSPYNPWFSQHSAVERSPSTAPHSGPNTPDYYSGHGGWGHVDTRFSGNRAYGYPTVPPYAPGLETFPSQYDSSAHNYPGASVWNCHGAACQCGSCRQAQLPRYGPIVVN